MMNQGKCVCVRCNNIFTGRVFWGNSYYPSMRQEECFCKDCIDELQNQNKNYMKLDINSTVYTVIKRIKDHQMYYEVLKGIITSIKFNNYDCTNSLRDVITKEDGKMIIQEDFADTIKAICHNFEPEYMLDRFKYKVVIPDLKCYERNHSELFKTLTEAKQYANKLNIGLQQRRNPFNKPEENKGDDNKMNKTDDMILMAQQSMVYDIIHNFLKTKLAIEGRITGLDINIEDGYVNASWKFGDRVNGDIVD